MQPPIFTKTVSKKLKDIELPQTVAAKDVGKAIAVIIGIIAAVAVGYYAYTQIQNFENSLNPLSWFGLAPKPSCPFGIISTGVTSLCTGEIFTCTGAFTCIAGKLIPASQLNMPVSCNCPIINGVYV
jgi:hypothetical protein